MDRSRFMKNDKLEAAIECAAQHALTIQDYEVALQLAFTAELLKRPKPPHQLMPILTAN